MSVELAIDLYQRGVIDNNTVEGIQNVRLGRGNLIPVPMRAGEYYAANPNSTAQMQAGGMMWNRDKSMSALNLNVPISAAGDVTGIEIWIEFWGPAFGIRFRRSLAATRNIDVMVDGVVYTVDTYATLLAAEGSPGNTTGEGRVLVVDGLPEGRHTAVIVITASTSVVRALLLHGILVDERAGYILPTPACHILDAVAVPTSDAAISLGSTPDQLRWMQRVWYFNTSAGSLTVTVKKNGATFKILTLAAGAGDVLDFGGPTAQAGLITHAASGSGINYFVEGGV